MFCVCEDSLPTASTKCQVTIEVPCVLRVSELVVVPVIDPEHLSVAVAAEPIVAVHWPVTSGRLATSATGAIVSVTTMFCVCEDSLPTASTKCQEIRRASCGVRVKILVVAASLKKKQLSVAVGAEPIVAVHW